jgi:hypothetical protein
MRQDEPDKNQPILVIDVRDQSTIVAADIENHANADRVRASPTLLYVRKMSPLRLLGDRIPIG